MPGNDELIARYRTELHEMLGTIRTHIDEADARQNEAEASEWSAEDKEIYDRMQADFSAREQALGREIEHAERERRLAAPIRLDNAPTGLTLGDVRNSGDSDIDDEIRNWLLTGQTPDGGSRNSAMFPIHGFGGEPNARDAAIARKMIDRPGAGRMLRPANRALSFTDAEGGFTVGEMEVSRYSVAQMRINSVYSVADVIPTSDGRDLPWPVTDDTGNEAVIRATNAAVTEEDVDFTEVILKAWNWNSKMVRIPLELLQDTQIPLEQIVDDALFERIARGQGRQFTVGADGAAGPIGVTRWNIPTARTITLTGANAFPGNNTAAYDNLVDVMARVDGAYQLNSTWMCNTLIRAELMKVRGAGGNLVFQLDARSPEFGVVLGKPLTINDFFPGYAVNSTFIMYGDFSQYKVREVQAARAVRLVERYAEFNQIALTVHARADGRPVSAGASMARLARGGT